MTTSEIDPEVLRRAGIQLDVSGAVATITMNKPEVRNAMTPATWHTLAAIGAELGEETRVVVIKGEGESFSSGIDRRLLGTDGVGGESSMLQLLELPDGEFADTIAGYQEGFTWLRRSDLITIAAVHGHALGAGFQLALACDLRMLADDAQLSIREPMLGLVPDLTGTKPLVELVGYSRALELCATARTVGAEEAREMGLATAVVPREELEDAVADLVGALTATSYGAVTETKALLQSATRLDLADQRRLEREAQVRRFRELDSLPGG